MKYLAALAALTLMIGTVALPAAARDSFVIDNAHLLSANAVSQINAKIADFNAIAHKDVVVVTEPSITDAPATAAERAFAQQQVNGVLIFVAKSPKTIYVVPGRSEARFFPAGSAAAIRKSIQASFNAGDFNGGINNGVDLTLSIYRSHLNSLPRAHAYAPVGAGSSVARSDASGGFHMGWIWWLIVLAVIFFVIRGIFRAIAGPRMMPPGGGQMGGPGYGQGGYGPGYGGGYGGGGGGFWSGMLGGLGGAFLGNELFGNRGGFGGGGENQAGLGGDPNAGDASGWQNDAGQSDMGNASGGGWGDSGGGGGDSGGWGGGGGGDFGGGGGGDSGGGGW